MHPRPPPLPSKEVAATAEPCACPVSHPSRFLVYGVGGQGIRLGTLQLQYLQPMSTLVSLVSISKPSDDAMGPERQLWLCQRTSVTEPAPCQATAWAAA